MNLAWDWFLRGRERLALSWERFKRGNESFAPAWEAIKRGRESLVPPWEATKRGRESLVPAPEWRIPRKNGEDLDDSLRPAAGERVGDEGSAALAEITSGPLESLKNHHKGIGLQSQADGFCLTPHESRQAPACSPPCARATGRPARPSPAQTPCLAPAARA